VSIILNEFTVKPHQTVAVVGRTAAESCQSCRRSCDCTNLKETFLYWVPQNSRNSMGQCQLMLEKNEKNTKKNLYLLDLKIWGLFLRLMCAKFYQDRSKTVDLHSK
jgi:hypothetical protein